jgi:hypothetical protein
VDQRGSTDAIRWDEKAGLRRDAIGSQVIDALEAQEIKKTGNKKIATAAAKQSKNFVEQKLTIGLDLGDSIELVLRVG